MALNFSTGRVRWVEDTTDWSAVVICKGLGCSWRSVGADVAGLRREWIEHAEVDHVTGDRQKLPLADFGCADCGSPVSKPKGRCRSCARPTVVLAA